MKITQSWYRCEPNTISGESIVLTIVFSSHNKAEIDELHEKMPKGVLIGDTEPPKEEQKK